MGAHVPRTWLPLLALAAATAWSPSGGTDATCPICRTALLQESIERDDLALSAALA